MSFDIEPIHIAYFILLVLVIACVVLSYYANLSKDEKSPHHKHHEKYLYSAIGCGVSILIVCYPIVQYHKNRRERQVPASLDGYPDFPPIWQMKLQRIK